MANFHVHKCTWLLPTYVKEVTYDKVKNIKFTSARKLKSILDNSIEKLEQSDLLSPLESSAPNQDNQKKHKPIPTPSAADLNDFLHHSVE